MNTSKKIYKIDLATSNEDRLEGGVPALEGILNAAVKSLKSGQVIALPTDTIYGVAALAQSTEAVNKLYEIKKRHEEKPVAICVGRLEDVHK